MVTTNHRRPAKIAAWPSARELKLSCSRLLAEVSELEYGGCRLVFHSIHTEHNPRGRVIKSHRHSLCEVVMILEGEAEELTPPYNRLKAGTVQVHGPGDPHAWRAPDSSLRRLGIWFTVRPRVPVRLPTHWPRQADLARQVRELLADTATATPGRHDRLVARLTLLLAPALALLELPASPPPMLVANPGETPSISPLVERFLADNLAEALVLDDVAAQFNLSVPTLTRRFHRETGTSVMARFQDLRLRHGAELLRAGTLSVKEVAAAVGIPEPSYFCRCFRQAFGVSPGRFKAAGGDFDELP